MTRPKVIALPYYTTNRVNNENPSDQRNEIGCILNEIPNNEAISNADATETTNAGTEGTEEVEASQKSFRQMWKELKEEGCIGICRYFIAW